MSGASAANSWLRGLNEDQLGEVLRRRPDVLLGLPPRDLSELAERLSHGPSIVTALRTLPMPCLEVAQAAQALGDGCTRADLADFLDPGGPDHRADVDRVVDRLIAYAVFAPGNRGGIALPAALGQIYPTPLGLGPPLRALLGELTLDGLRQLQYQLGLAREKSRERTVAGLLAFFGNGDAVRALVSTAPPDVRAHLLALARPGADADRVIYSSQGYLHRHEATTWAGARGLMIVERWGYGWRIPAEVTLALRGSGYRAPFTPHPPRPVLRPADRDRVERDSSAAATLFCDEALGLLDHIVRHPVASVKSGGIGTRELTRLAKVAGADEVAVRLALELADAAGLLDRHGQSVPTSENFPAWRTADPGRRLHALLRAWWDLGATPTQTRDADDKVRRALDNPGYCEGCRAARVVLIETMAGLDGCSDLDSVAPAALWARPLVHVVVEDADQPLASVWREAERLGVIAQGAVSELGRALLAGDEQALLEQATRLVPKSADQATFGTDLTVFVAGAPSADVSALLDAAADREGRGGAVTWRFSPSSVRRALDEGVAGAVLAAALADISVGPLPQPLSYLIADVARRHGNVRLGPATSFIRSDDEALLAQVAADRKLAKLGLRPLAPTVLASDATEAVLMAALRAAGYFPVADGFSIADDGSGANASRGSAGPPDGEPSGYRSPARTGPRSILTHADAKAIAAALRSGRTGPSALINATEQRVRALAPSLSVAEIRQLAHAIDTQSRVLIDYQSSTGDRTTRVIEAFQLAPDGLSAWCELREDLRTFAVDRIRSVTAL